MFPTGRIPGPLTHPSPAWAHVLVLRPNPGWGLLSLEPRSLQWFRPRLILAASRSPLMGWVLPHFPCVTPAPPPLPFCSGSSSLAAGPKRQSGLNLASGFSGEPQVRNKGKGMRQPHFQNTLVKTINRVNVSPWTGPHPLLVFEGSLENNLISFSSASSVDPPSRRPQTQWRQLGAASAWTSQLKCLLPREWGPGLWEQTAPSLCLVWLGLIWAWLRQTSLIMGAPSSSALARAAALRSLVRQAWGR